MFFTLPAMHKRYDHIQHRNTVLCNYTNETTTTKNSKCDDEGVMLQKRITSII